jgi:hypothetical protein
VGNAKAAGPAPGFSAPLNIGELVYECAADGGSEEEPARGGERDCCRARVRLLCLGAHVKQQSHNSLMLIPSC